MQKGVLILVATTIGNPADLSQRAIDTLGAADLVLCEDTRVTGVLLSHLCLDKSLLSYHDHNEASRIDQVLGYLSQGKTIALVSDAGMPTISDPGQRLVRAATAAGYSVSVVPGPSAGVAALAVSGLDTRRYHFEGFLEVKGAARRNRLKAIAGHEVTTIIYEAPHRLLKTLHDLSSLGLAERNLAVVRELTKPYEEILYLTVKDAITHFEQKRARGEFVLVLEGKDAYFARLPDRAEFERNDRLNDAAIMILSMLKAGRTKTDIRKTVQMKFGLGRNEVYRLLLDLESRTDMLK